MDASDWRKIEERHEEHSRQQMEHLSKKGSAAERAFFGASLYAKDAAKEQGLMPERREDGEVRYTVQQGLRAACCAREDAAATLVIQLAILRRLDTQRKLLWFAIALLAYIAYSLK